MSAAQLEVLASLANKRLVEFINRMAAQQVRRMREAWRAGA